MTNLDMFRGLGKTKMVLCLITLEGQIRPIT